MDFKTQTCASNSLLGNDFIPSPHLSLKNLFLMNFLEDFDTFSDIVSDLPDPNINIVFDYACKPGSLTFIMDDGLYQNTVPQYNVLWISLYYGLFQALSVLQWSYLFS